MSHALFRRCTLAVWASLLLMGFVRAEMTSISTASASEPMVLSSGTAVVASTGATIITLPYATRLALDHATDVLKAKNALEFSGAQLLQAYAEFLPSLDTSATYNWNWGREYLTSGAPAIVDTANHGASYQIVSVLNAFNGFSDVGTLGAGRQRRRAANLSLYRARQLIVLDVTEAYLDVLLDRQIALIGEKNLEASREREQLLEAQTKAGLKSLADLYRQQAQTSADELFLINARNRAHNDLIALLQRLRLDLLTPYDVSDVQLDPPSGIDPYQDETALMHRALAQRPDLQAEESLANAAHWDVTTARGGYYPQLDLFADFGGSGRWLDRQTVSDVDVVPSNQDSLSEQLHRQTSTTAGVTATWGVFSRYLTGLNVARAQEASKDADIDYQDRRLEVEGEVQQTVGDYHAAISEIDAASRGLKAAQESYDAVKTRYGVGASSIVDLLTAQSALVEAQASDAQSRIDFVVRKKAVETALGQTPLP